MTPADVNRYIGLAWESGARGPQAFDCWGLLMDVRERYFGGGIPETPFGEATLQMYEDKMRSGQWEIVSAPSHGDGVLLREESQPHVGIYLDFDGGGILHALRGAGVIYTELRELRLLGFANPKYYRIHG